MRISSALFLIAPALLAGCKPAQTDNKVLAGVEADSAAARADDGRVSCAKRGADFTSGCTIDREAGKDGLVLTVRNPDGGFHRLLVTKDGRGVIAADGAETAKVTVIGPEQIEVALGGDRYRLPATVRNVDLSKR